MECFPIHWRQWHSIFRSPFKQFALEWTFSASISAVILLSENISKLFNLIKMCLWGISALLRQVTGDPLAFSVETMSTFVLLTSSQKVLMLLVHGPHLEKHRFNMYCILLVNTVCGASLIFLYMHSHWAVLQILNMEEEFIPQDFTENLLYTRYYSRHWETRLFIIDKSGAYAQVREERQ